MITMNKKFTLVNCTHHNFDFPRVTFIIIDSRLILPTHDFLSIVNKDPFCIVNPPHKSSCFFFEIIKRKNTLYGF